MADKKKSKNLFRVFNISIIVLLIVAMVFVFVLRSGILSKTPTIEIKPNNSYDKTLRVITDMDYMPYSFFDEGTNTYTGHDVELITMIANELQMNLDIKFMPWDRAIKAMNNGQADVLMTCDYSDTFAGVETLLKTEPVSTDEFIVYSKQNIKSVDELYAKDCSVMENGNVTAQIRLLNIEKNCGLYKDNREAMKAVEDNLVDCAIMRYTVGEALLKELGYKDIKGTISIGQSYMCFGVQNDNTELANQINQALEKYKISGDIEKLHDKWLTTFVHTYSFGEFITNNVAYVIGFVFLIVIALLLLVRSERKKIAIEEENTQYEKVIENLANDFECINIVDLNDNKFEDSAVLLRTSEVFTRNIPEWSTEKNIHNRLEYFYNLAVVPEDKEMFRTMTRREVILENLQKDGVYFVNFRAVIDGIINYYQMKFSANHNDKGEITSYILGVHNIDAQTKKEIADNEALQNALANEKRVEQKLAEDKVLLNYFVEAYSSAYFVNLENSTFEILRSDSRFNAVDNANGNREDMYKFIDEHIHPEDKELILKMSEPEYVINRLKTEDNYTFTIREIFDDVERTMRCLIVKGIDEKHIAVGFMDISEELEKEKETQRMLEAASKSKSDFLFNMSHDIRTPMNAITGFTELAEKHIEDKEKVEDYLGKIKNSSNHLLEIINEVLDMSRVEAGKLTSEMKTLNIVDEAEKLVTISKETANARNIKLSLIADDIIHKTVIADELHVNRIIDNILGNAVKYTMPGGSIVYSIVELESDNPDYGKYEFIIEDTGIGMSKEFLDKIFESFSREETETVHEIQGTGLGMSIVKKLVDYLDGTIDIESTKGKGTKVTIVLHFKLAEASEESKKISALDINFKGKKVLLVEDNDLNREIATDILEEQGIIVDEAVNGKEAVSVIKNKGTNYYDFILMDIQMPFMNGYEATEAIRKLPGSENIVIIALSANAFEEDKQKSLASGMNDHIAKPIKIKELFECLAKYL